jgi:hypothetical protein
MDSFPVATLSALAVFIIFVLCCVTVSNTNKIKNGIKELSKIDFFSSINVNFALNSTTEIVKTFVVPPEHILVPNVFIAFNTCTFPAGTTLSFKAATSLHLLQSSPDLQVSEHVDIFGVGSGGDTSGTQITIYNYTNVNIETNLVMEPTTVFLSLQLSHAPLSGGPLKVAFIGNYANIAFEFQY